MTLLNPFFGEFGGMYVPQSMKGLVNPRCKGCAAGGALLGRLGLDFWLFRPTLRVIWG